MKISYEFSELIEELKEDIKELLEKLKEQDRII